MPFLLPLQIHPATVEDEAWVNKQYTKINFSLSELSKDYVAIASWQNEPAGLGRLQRVVPQVMELGGIYVFEDFRKKGIAGRLVQHLWQQVPAETMVYCLPFQSLLPFYKNFGFKELPLEQSEVIPDRIKEKLDWCAATYADPVMLLAQQKLVNLINRVKNN